MATEVHQGDLVAPVSPASILLIDDSHEARTVMSKVLRTAGYAVHTASDASEALDELERSAPPDLILLDLIMPRMSGWEFRLKQRGQPRLANIPVIVTSGSRAASARAIDADAFLPKPFDAKSLLSVVELRLQAAERRKLAARALDLERLSSLGVLAASIAHEVNNPLAVVAGNVELALAMLSALDGAEQVNERSAIGSVLRSLADAQIATARVAAVVRSVSSFSHPQDDKLSVVCLNEVLESSIRLTSNELRHRARVTLELEPDLCVLGNAAQLGQVFINLLTNAAHSVREGEPGNHGVRLAGWRTAGGRTIVEVSDTGRGIAPEHLKRVFEPFFTTRPLGMGMGLGLAICKRLVNAFGGTIAVRSTGGQGSCFRVDLPSYQVADQPRAPVSEPPRESLAPPRRRPRLMVVDDEALMCTLLGHMLGAEFDVVTFSSPRAALEAIRSDGNFDVVLSDLMMPELSGMELYREIVRVRPAMASRILFMTGGTFTDPMTDFMEELGVEPLLKPFTVLEVVERISTLLEHEGRRVTV